MRREISRFAEPAEVDDLCRAARRRAGRDRGCGSAIPRLEVTPAERVHKVVDDLGPTERAAHRSGIGRICGNPLDPVLDARGGGPQPAPRAALARPHRHRQ